MTNKDNTNLERGKPKDNGGEERRNDTYDAAQVFARRLDLSLEYRTYATKPACTTGNRQGGEERRGAVGSGKERARLNLPDG